MSENLHLVFRKPPEAISDDEYNRWYDFHLGEILVVPGFISANVALLTKGALKAMLWTKLKLLAVMLLTLTLIGTGSSLWAYRPAPEALAANEDDKPDQDKKRDDQDAPQKSKETWWRDTSWGRTHSFKSPSIISSSRPRSTKWDCSGWW